MGQWQLLDLPGLINKKIKFPEGAPQYILFRKKTFNCGGADFDNQSNFQDHLTFSCISIKPSHGEENLPAEEKRRKSGLS